MRLIKWIIGLTLFFMPGLFGLSMVFGEDRLPELNPDKPLYQAVVPGLLGVGGVYREVKVPEPKTKEQAKLQAEIDRIKADTEAYKDKLRQQAKQRTHGHLWIKIGAAVFVLGAFAFVALRKWGAEEFGALGALFGVGCVCYGAIVAQLAGKEAIIAWGAIAIFVTSIAIWICKGNSIFEKIKNRRKSR